MCLYIRSLKNRVLAFCVDVCCPIKRPKTNARKTKKEEKSGDGEEAPRTPWLTTTIVPNAGGWWLAAHMHRCPERKNIEFKMQRGQHKTTNEYKITKTRTEKNNNSTKNFRHFSYVYLWLWLFFAVRYYTVSCALASHTHTHTRTANSEHGALHHSSEYVFYSLFYEK